MLTDYMCRSLGDAAKECYPVKRKRKKKKKKRIWSEHIKDPSRFSKKQFWLWKQAGRPRESDDIFFVNIKVAKKNLRSVQ
jgi:hypothetical protein